MEGIYVAQNGTQLGPFSEEVVKSMLASQELLMTDHAWSNDRSEWVPISEFFKEEEVSAKTESQPAIGEGSNSLEKLGESVETHEKESAEEPNTVQPEAAIHPKDDSTDNSGRTLAPSPSLSQAESGDNTQHSTLPPASVSSAVPSKESVSTDKVTVDLGTAMSLRKYFSGSGRVLPWVLIVLGIPLCLLWVGFIMIPAGIVMLFRQSSPIADNKVDMRVESVMAAHDFVSRARELCAFTEFVREPILLTGIAGDDLIGSNFSGERVGDDGVYRATPLEATVLLSTPDQLGIYRTAVDVITGNRVNERFLEVFYQDVVAVTVGEQTKTYDLQNVDNRLERIIDLMSWRWFLKLLMPQQKGIQQALKNAKKLRKNFGRAVVADMLQLEASRVYRIDLADGQHIQMRVADGRPTCEANESPFASSGGESAKAMHAFRLFVRDKKRGFLRKEIAG